MNDFTNNNYFLSGKLVRHYKTKHSDRDLPDGLLTRIPSMSHEELNTTLSQLAAAAADRNSSVQLSREGENGDSDGTQDLEVTAASSYVVMGYNL